MQFNPTIELGGIASTLSVLAALGIFLYQNWKSNRLRKTEIYQGMEFASNELFGFEAQHNKALERFRDVAPVRSKFSDEEWKVLTRFAEIEAGGAEAVDASPAFAAAHRQIEEDIRVVRKYYEKTLNMFEVAARFRHESIVEDRVFGSWVIWYYDTCQEWSFRWLWPKLRKNYIPELRQVFDFPAAYFAFEGPDAEPNDVLEHDFFVHVARVIRCKTIATWLDDAERDSATLGSSVQSRGVPDYRRWPVRYGGAPTFRCTRRRKAVRAIDQPFPGSDPALIPMQSRAVPKR